jgi:hypothetical protein
MATYFVNSAGSNTAPYDTEAKAANILDTIEAIPWVAGDVVKMASTHSETTAGWAFSFPTTGVPIRILSVAFNGSGTGGLSAGATLSGGTGTAVKVDEGLSYWHGVTLTASSANAGTADMQIAIGSFNAFHVFHNCAFSLPSTNVNAEYNIGRNNTNSDKAKIWFVNCSFSRANVAQAWEINGVDILFQNITLSGTAPTNLFRCGPQHASARIVASDLSGVAWTNILNTNSADSKADIVLSQCKLPSGTALITGTIGLGAETVTLNDCDAGDNHYTYIKEDYSGTVSMSNSIYVDASNGTDNLSFKMVSTANSSWPFPLTSPQITTWNSGTSAVTTSIPIVYDNATNLTDAQIWQETMAKVTSGSTKGTWNIGDRSADILAAGTDQAADTSTWTGTGGFTNENKDKLVSGSFTPAEVGPIVSVVKLAKASTTVYVSPKVTIA